MGELKKEIVNFAIKKSNEIKIVKRSLRVLCKFAYVVFGAMCMVILTPEMYASIGDKILIVASAVVIVLYETSRILIGIEREQRAKSRKNLRRFTKRAEGNKIIVDPRRLEEMIVTMAFFEDEWEES